MTVAGMAITRPLLGKLIGALSIALAAWGAYSSIYESGYQAAVSEYNEGFAERAQEAVEKASAIHRVQLVKLKREHDAEVARLRAEQVIETKIETVTEYVDRIEVKTECSGLAADVVGVLSEVTDAVTIRDSGRTQTSYQF